MERGYRQVLNLLFLGNVCDDKGIFGLIHFLRTNKYFLDNQIRLFIGGNGEINRLIKLIEAPVFNNNIEYCGWVKADTKRLLLCSCDVFILPSFVEGLPVSILEAMACHKPIIATNVGGIPSIVKNNYNGWLIDPGAFFQLDTVFEKIFSNKQVLLKYSANSLLASKKYSVDVILAELSDLYQSILL